MESGEGGGEVGVPGRGYGRLEAVGAGGGGDEGVAE